MEYKFTLDNLEIDAVIYEILRRFSYTHELGLSKEIVFDVDKYLKMIEQYTDDKKNKCYYTYS